MEENLRAVQAYSQDQPHSTVVEISLLSDHGGFVCNTCGIAFASEEWRAMHIKHRHPEIHLQAGAAFNRGTHSLSLASPCVDCVAGVFTIGGQCANASLPGRVLRSRTQPPEVFPKLSCWQRSEHGSSGTLQRHWSRCLMFMTLGSTLNGWMRQYRAS